MLTPSVRPRDALPAVLVAVGVGGGLWVLWWGAGYPAGVFTPGLEGHGSSPAAWPRLLGVWVPLAHLLFALAYVLLARWDRHAALRWHFVADGATVLLVPVLIIALLVLKGAGPWRSLVGGWYVLFVALKTGILLHALWVWLAGQPDTRRVGPAVFLGAFVPYLLLSGYTTTAISASGDEPYYLVVTHSLVHDGDTDLSNNFAARDYLPFYWGRLDPTQHMQVTAEARMYSRAYTGLQPVLLVPGYWVAGRTGAAATMDGLSAATLMLAFLLALRLGAGLRAAFLAWLGVALSVPIVSFAGSPFPEMSGALFATLAAFLLLRDRKTVATYTATALCLVALLVLKNRFFLPTVPLVLGFAERVTRKTLVAVTAGLLVGLGAAVGYDALVFQGIVWRRMETRGLLFALRFLAEYMIQPLLQYRGLLGSLLDQEYGLLLVAPVFLLALAGATIAAVQRRWRLLLLVGGPCAISWFYLSGTWFWYGGFNPPARFLVVGLPLLTAFVALALDRVRGRLGWSLTVGLYTITLGYTVILSVWPAWRFQSTGGRATALARLLWGTGLDPGRLLPSYITPGLTWVGPGLAILASALVAGRMLAKRAGGDPAKCAVALGVLGTVLVAGGLVAYVFWRPWGTYPAAAWPARGGTRFYGAIPVDSGRGVARQPRLVWVAQGDGVLELTPRLPAGRYRLVIRAGGQGPGSGPTLSLLAGQAPGHRVVVDAAPPPAWRESEYAFDVQWRGGRLPLRIELSEVSRASPVRRAYLAHLRVERVGP